jgi:hypothetical protein
MLSILFNVDLKKLIEKTTIQAFYATIRGKINSGTRTKYFQLKAPNRPSFIKINKTLLFGKTFSNAKTGAFGVQS